MVDINIVKRLFGLEKVRREVKIKDEITTVAKDGDSFAIIHGDGYIVISTPVLETEIIRKILVNSIPAEYKVEVTQVVTEDLNYSIKCSVHSIRTHHTLVFSYGRTHIEATGKCLLELNRLIEKDELEYDELK